MTFTESDHQFMTRALRLARTARAIARPNPQVGCVLVRDGSIVGEGTTQRAGDAHAEIVALQAAGSQARGATAYVTLEPCAHEGRTPPCTSALIAAGVVQVIYAMDDPNPLVDGAGAQQLAAAGIRVHSGLMNAQAREQLRGFVSRVRRARPFIFAKTAISLDGRTAMASGESKWITSAVARRDVQNLRSRADAILTGVGTVLDDDPKLTVRDAGATHDCQPLRVVLDSHLRTSVDARIIAEPGDTIFFCVDDSGADRLRAVGATVAKLAPENGMVSLESVVQALAEREINEVMIEAGPRVLGGFMQQGLLDELVIYMGPHIMGNMTRPMAETPAWQTLQSRLQLSIHDMRMVGDDIRIVARPATQPGS